jgi:hypothetical protein
VRPGIPGRGPYAARATADFVRTHTKALEVDLRRYYSGLDLRDLWRPGGGASKLTYRLIRVLIDGLPPESLTKTAIRDTLTSEDFEDAPEPDGWGAWSKTDELLAVLVDQVGWLTYSTYAAQGGKPHEPTPIRRPGVGLSGAQKRALKAELEYRQRVTAAHVAYAMANAGAYPPDGWDHGVPDIDD